MFTLSMNSKLIRALTLISSGTLLATTLGLAEAKAQDPAAIEQFNEQFLSTQRLAQRVIPPLRTRMPVQASLGSVEADSISVTLTNNSPLVITYQSTSIPTDTLELMPGEQQTFDDVSAPLNIAFYQKDGGLTSAEVVDVNRQTDSFEVELTSAETLGEDERTIVLLETGNIYLY